MATLLSSCPAIGEKGRGALVQSLCTFGSLGTPCFFLRPGPQGQGFPQLPRFGQLQRQRAAEPRRAGASLPSQRVSCFL